MAVLLNEEGLNSIYFSVFRDALSQWVEKSKLSNLSGFVGDASFAVDGLADVATLSTGTSMSIIWKESRPIVPSNWEQWKAYNKLLGLMDEFDRSVCFQTGNNLTFLTLTLKNT
jgi:midasin (ATPase involved in ribosome maturation)